MGDFGEFLSSSLGGATIGKLEPKFYLMDKSPKAQSIFSFLVVVLKFIYLFLAVLGLHCCVQVVSSWQQVGATLLLCSMWGLPRSGIEPISVYWQLDSLTTGLPGKSLQSLSSMLTLAFGVIWTWV